MGQDISALIEEREQNRLAQFPAEYYKDKDENKLPREGVYELRHSNGQIKFRCGFRNGLLDGPCEWFWESGRPMKRYVYVSGSVQGLYESWFENGQQQFHHNFKDGKRDGVFREWYSNGQLSSDMNFVQNLAQGPCTEFWENGKPQLTTVYINDFANGQTTVFNKDGVLIMDAVLQDGIPISARHIDHEQMEQTSIRGIRVYFASEETLNTLTGGKNKRQKMRKAKKSR